MSLIFLGQELAVNSKASNRHNYTHTINNSTYLKLCFTHESFDVYIDIRNFEWQPVYIQNKNINFSLDDEEQMQSYLHWAEPYIIYSLNNLITNDFVNGLVLLRQKIEKLSMFL
jgi:hypothetical protein